MRTILITGAGGLIGSEAVKYYAEQGWSVVGIDNNMRSAFFGPKGDVTWNIRQLEEKYNNFINYELDIRYKESLKKVFEVENMYDAIIHCAAQPSHDKAASIPYLDFEVNAVGTLNMLEATRLYCPNAVFVHVSTNKVYGDRPNSLPLIELEKRYGYEYDDNGLPAEDTTAAIDETMSVDQCKHSLFGASKLAADIMAQEYGKYFGIKTGIFRGGCLTGPSHSGVELHGFLNYIIKCAALGQKYTVYGYKGKQVRDQIHSYDVIRAFDEFIKNPRCGEVYNIGGGRANSASILEIIDILDSKGLFLDYQYNDTNRIGDHMCYITDLSKLKSHYPNWSITKSLDNIIDEIIEQFYVPTIVK